jgi:sodium transport system ATP-binding protein
MIEVSAVAKSFGTVQAVRQVSFLAADGSVTGLLGPNGAGKTTVLRMISGLMSPDGGSIQVDGMQVAAQRIAVRRRLGVLPDARGLYPRLTAREHVELFGQLQGVPARLLRERCTRLFALLGLTELADRRVAGFSNGERSKVAIARALVHEPGNVILDEPTNGLDVASIRAIRELIRGLRSEGRCVLFSSHVMQEVAALCDRIVVIARGTIAASGTPDHIRQHAGCDDLEEAFVALTGAPQDTAVESMP